MEKFSGTKSSVSGLPWDRFMTSNLIQNPILGYVTQDQIDLAVRSGWIKKLDGIWKVLKGNVPCHTKDHTRVKGYNHNFGDYIPVASTSYTAHKDAMHAKDKAEMYNEEAGESLIETSDIPNF